MGDRKFPETGTDVPGMTLKRCLAVLRRNKTPAGVEDSRA